ncbi:MAG: hypothetical protein JKP98_14455 [Rhodobacteraceae bacterium]|nr:hypothetical protein [Paracoccaceae bacterium]
MAGFDPADPTFQNDPGRFRLVFQTRWLLTEIRDTQATPNVVTIAYEVSQSGMGYSTAPRHIAYGGYNIWLNYDWKPTHARTKYATGTQFLGIQWRRLRSVEVRDGDTPIRAYGLEYSQSAQTGTLLLTRVRQYGRDFEKQSNGPRITGGTQLPSWTFDYRGNHTAFTARTYGGGPLHRLPMPPISTATSAMNCCFRPIATKSTKPGVHQEARTAANT